GVPTSHYAAQKAEVESILDRVQAEHSEVLATGLRPGLIFQSAAGPEIKDYFLGDLIPARLVARLRTPVLPFPRGLR
ncbi:epimerase, partial [Xanthomonas citri pv. citri]|nr:epimerase [Xanthomonas citri pv. citri]